MSYRQNMEADAERRRLEREQRRQGAPTGEGAPDPVPGAGELTVPSAQSSVPVPPPAQRPQPFTPDLIPEPVALDATGELTAQELDELQRCERAFANADAARWMAGKAAAALRERKLFRGQGRTWPQYCEEELGQSESDVNRQISRWELAEAVTQIWVTGMGSVPDSHLDTLLEVTKTHGVAAVAQGYVRLRQWAKGDGIRVTAAFLNRALEASTAEPFPVDGSELRAIEAARLSVPVQASPLQTTPGAAPVVAPKGATSAASPRPAAPLPTQSASSDHQDEDDELVEAELVDTEAVREVVATLAAMADGIEGRLDGGSPESLTAIAEASRSIAAAADKALESMESPKFG